MAGGITFWLVAAAALLCYPDLRMSAVSLPVPLFEDGEFNSLLVKV
jgi:hypothetical protein